MWLYGNGRSSGTGSGYLVAKPYTFTLKSVAAALTKMRTQIVLNAGSGCFVLCHVKAVDYLDVFVEHSEQPHVRPITKSL